VTSPDIRALAIAAESRIRPHVRKTPVRRSDALSTRYDADVHLKLENLQTTGSFKARGAFNKLLALDDRARAHGVVAASTGNHGLAMAYAMRALGVGGVVFVPVGAASSKVGNIRSYGAEVRFFGEEGGATEGHARAYAAERSMVYVSPYNDIDVVAGQATVGVEIARQIADVDVLVASLGGGGLVSGAGGYLKACDPRVTVVAASPANSKAMMESVRAGRVVRTRHLPTLSDATAGGIDEDTITFEMCRRIVDDYVEVDEDAIRSALRGCIEMEHMLAEGSAALAIAGLGRTAVAGRRVVVIVCGANIDAAKLKEAL